MFHMLKVNVHEIWSSTVNVVLQCCFYFFVSQSAQQSYLSMYILNIVIFKKCNSLAVKVDGYIFGCLLSALCCICHIHSLTRLRGLNAQGEKAQTLSHWRTLREGHFVAFFLVAAGHTFLFLASLF